MAGFLKVEKRRAINFWNGDFLSRSRRPFDFNGIALSRRGRSRVEGFLPTDWFPGAVAADNEFAYVANVKGLGSRNGRLAVGPYKSSDFLGTLDRIPIPRGAALRKATAQVVKNARVIEIERALRAGSGGAAPVPVPLRPGEPSVFKHVLSKRETADIQVVVILDFKAHVFKGAVLRVLGL